MLALRIARRVAPLARHPIPRQLSRAPLPLPPPRLAARCYATGQQSANPTAQFYKTFTRPVAKVLLAAVLTYQLAYWAWMKLETDEVRAETDTTLADLEAQVDGYKRARDGAKTPAGGRAS